VDDGKSTLIGRLLHDSKRLFDDQLAALEPTAAATAPRASASTTRCCSTAWPPSASRASPSTWPTASSIPTAQVHRRRLPRPRAVHPQHGHRRLDRRPGGGAGRRAQGPAAADPPAQLHRLAARHPPRGAGGQQDGSGRLRAACSTHRRVPRIGRAAGHRQRAGHPAVGAGGRQPVDAFGATPWYAGPACWNTWRRAGGQRRRRHGLRLPVQWVNRPNLDFRGFAGTFAAGTCARRRGGGAAVGAAFAVARCSGRTASWPSPGAARR
jgi:bifunctional enzyme CysN/CysC